MTLNAILKDTIRSNVATALAEDIGLADVTAQLLPEASTATATVISREAAVVCGQPWFEEVFRQVDARCTLSWAVSEGEHVAAGALLCTIQGPARSLLTAERTALNFMQTLSATATLTHRYVQAISAYPARIMDTRKTLPGLRLAQKYAVRTGGGANQRIGLFDGILIKENHILAAGGIRPVLAQALALAGPGVSVQIEVETLEELAEALEAGAQLILLDNMSLQQMREAVELSAGRAELEASGGVDIDRVAAIAATGVQRISIGKLTKDVQAIDLSMRLQR